MRLMEPGVGVAALPAEGIVVRRVWQRRILTFFMVFGPGLIVMEADDATGAVSTYMQGERTILLSAPPLAARAVTADLLLHPGNGCSARNRDRQGPRRNDLRALRQVVGQVLTARSAGRKLPHIDYGVRCDLTRVECARHQPFGINIAWN
jgi:hypothetical protein